MTRLSLASRCISAVNVMTRDAIKPAPLSLTGPHLAFLLQLPFEVLHLLGIGKFPSGQLGNQRLLFFQLPGQLPWGWNDRSVGHGPGKPKPHQGQAKRRSGAPTILRLQFGSLCGEVIEGALGFFQLYSVFIGLVLQCPRHFLQVCLHAVTSRGKVCVGRARAGREEEELCEPRPDEGRGCSEHRGQAGG